MILKKDFMKGGK